MPEHAYEDLARTALLEITTAESVGAYAGQVDEGNGAISVLFDSAMPGYPDWKWTVSIAHVEGAEPTVLEAELMPAEGALLAPDWVPWSERLAEYEAGAASSDDAEDDEDSDDDDSDDDESDDDESDDDSEDDELIEDDELAVRVVHGGDVDGVDIDELDDVDDDGETDDFDDDPDEENEKTY